MSAEVCVVTGANNGFGLVTAQRLATQGATVLMVCRSQARGEAARQRIAEKTQNPPRLFLGDLSLQKDVRRIVAEIGSAHPRIDVLVNNAGYAYAERELTGEGFERTFALNYLAYFTLSLGLLPQLRAAKGARIVNVASSAHRWEPISLDNLQGEKRFPLKRMPPLPLMYGWTNSYRIMLSFELAARLKQENIYVNCACPGFVPVRRSTASSFQNFMTGVFAKTIPGTRTPEQAAVTMLELASPEVGMTGAYFESGKQVRAAEQTYDRALRQALFAKTFELLGREGERLSAQLVSDDRLL